MKTATEQGRKDMKNRRFEFRNKPCQRMNWGDVWRDFLSNGFDGVKRIGLYFRSSLFSHTYSLSHPCERLQETIFEVQEENMTRMIRLETDKAKKKIQDRFRLFLSF